MFAMLMAVHIKILMQMLYRGTFINDTALASQPLLALLATVHISQPGI
jgi:hypothetical protein